MIELNPKKNNIALDLDGTILDSRWRHICVLADCINQINGTVYAPENFDDFVSYKSEGNTGLFYLKDKKIPNETAIISLWMKRIEYKKYLRSDKLYPNVLSDLKKMSDRYNLFLLTARSNPSNARWQLSELGIGEFFREMMVVENTGDVGLNKYQAIRSIPLAFVIGDTEADLALAKYARCEFFPLNYGFRSAQYWKKNGLKSYNNIIKIFSIIKK